MVYTQLTPLIRDKTQRYNKVLLEKDTILVRSIRAATERAEAGEAS